jgi:hypothetical protein
MRIYVASSWRNTIQPDVVKLLRKHGHEVYDFKHPQPNNEGFHWSEIDPAWKEWTPRKFRSALGHSIAVDGFNSDFRAMEDADACVLVLPCGRSAHLEAGWFVGNGKPLLIYLPPGEMVEPELMYAMSTAICLSTDELLSQVRLAGG